MLAKCPHPRKGGRLRTQIHDELLTYTDEKIDSSHAEMLTYTAEQIDSSHAVLLTYTAEQIDSS
jgi:hypothetical protein